MLVAPTRVSYRNRTMRCRMVSPYSSFDIFSLKLPNFAVFLPIATFVRVEFVELLLFVGGSGMALIDLLQVQMIIILHITIIIVLIGLGLIGLGPPR